MVDKGGGEVMVRKRWRRSNGGEAMVEKAQWGTMVPGEDVCSGREL